MPKLPYKVENDPNNPDPNRDARVQAFNNAEAWAKAIGDVIQDDGGHGCLGDRAADKGAAVAAGADGARKQRQGGRERSRTR